MCVYVYLQYIYIYIFVFIFSTEFIFRLGGKKSEEHSGYFRGHPLTEPSPGSHMRVVTTVTE